MCIIYIYIYIYTYIYIYIYIYMYIYTYIYYGWVAGRAVTEHRDMRPFRPMHPLPIPDNAKTDRGSLCTDIPLNNY